MAAVDWSKLPTELLNLISQRIDDEIDLIRFRSTCSTWRSSSVLKLLQILPFKFPLFKLPFLSDPNHMDTINGNNPPLCHLSKQTLYLIKPPPQQQEEEQTLLRPRLIRVSQNTRGQTRFFHPLLNRFPLSWEYLFCLVIFNLYCFWAINAFVNKTHTVCLESHGDEFANHVASSPPYFSVSPPVRAANPLVQDARFGNEIISSSPSGLPSPNSASRKGGCVRMSFGLKPAAVRVEGFDCLNRDRQNSSVPAVA